MSTDALSLSGIKDVSDMLLPFISHCHFQSDNNMTIHFSRNFCEDTSREREREGVCMKCVPQLFFLATFVSEEICCTVSSESYQNKQVTFY